MSILALATGVTAALVEGVVGQWASNGDVRRTGTLINQSPQAAQVSTITVSGPTNSKTYTVTINGFDVSYTSDGSATTQEVVDGLVAAINADPRVRGEVKAVSTSSTVATLTGLIPGRAFTLSESDSELATATTTAAASAAAISPGRGVVSQGFSTGYNDELGALAASAVLTAQVQTIAVTYVASNVLRARIWEIRGGEETLLAEREVTAATDLDTTLDALVAALEASLPANTVSVTANNATATAVVFTAEIAGFEFRAEIARVSGGASEPTITSTNTTGPSPSTSIHRALRGVSMRPLDEECATIGGTAPQWPANKGVVVAKEGPLYVDSPTGVTAGAPAYIELGAGTDTGKFFMTGSATRVRLPRSLVEWVRDGSVAADALAVLRLNLP